MLRICFYFQVHQPYRIKKYSVFDIGSGGDYFDSGFDNNLNNKKILKRVAEKSYIPANNLFVELLKKYPEFKISFSFSGVFLSQLEEFMPEVLESFQRLIATGRVEVLSETYYHSLAFLFSKQEFADQIDLHKKKIKKLFGLTPKVFRNTELIYNNELADFVSDLGFKGIITEGADHLLKGRSPNFLYHPYKENGIKVLLKNYKLSDDIAFRFSNKDWEEYPLTSEKFASWVSSHNGDAEVINLFMDYETFGEHQWEDSGIFEFLRNLPEQIYKHPDNNFVTPSEVVDLLDARDYYDVHNFISWADIERDLSAWLSNSMQNDAIYKLYELEEKVKSQNNKTILEDWRKMQTSDHFYYMCTKWFSDGDVHKYFNPYESPYDAFISFINALQDLKLRLEESKIT